MANKVFDSLSDVKDSLLKAKDSAVTAASAVLDANNDGTVDIQDIIILAVKTPGVHVRRDLFLHNEFFKNHPEEVVADAIARTPRFSRYTR